MIVPVCIHSFKYSYAHYSLMMMAFDNYLGWYLSLVVFGIIISALEFVPYDHASLDGKSDDDQIVDAVYLLPQLYVTIGLSIPLVANYIADIVSSLSKHSKTSNQEKFMFITRSFLYSTIIAQSVLLLISDEELKTTYVVFLYRIQRYLLMSTCVSCLYGLEPYQKLIKFSTFVLQCILLLSQILLTLTHFVDGSAERIGLLYFSFSLNIIVTAVTFGFGFYLIKSLVNQLIQHKSLLFLSRHQILYSGYLFIMFLDAAFWLDLYNSANGDQMQLLGIFSGKVDSTYNDFALCLLVFAVIIVVLEILTIKFDDFNTKRKVVSDVQEQLSELTLLLGSLNDYTDSDGSASSLYREGGTESGSVFRAQALSKCAAISSLLEVYHRAPLNEINLQVQSLMQANEQTLRQAMDPSHTILLVQPDDQCNNIKVQSDSYIEESTAQLEIIQLQSTMKYDTQLEVTDNKIINNTRGFVPMPVTNGITAMSGVTSQNTREQQQQCQSSGNIRSSSWSKDNRYPAKSAFQPNYLALKNNKSSPSEGDGLEMRITRVGEVVGEDCDDDNYSYDSNFADVDVETITDKPFQSRVSDELHPLTTSNQSTSMSNTNKGNLYMKLPHQPARARKSNSSSITTQSMLFDRQTTGTGKTSSFLGRASRLTDLSGFMSSKMGEAKALMVRHSYVDTNSQVDLPQSEELATQASEADQYSSVRSGAQVALIDPHASSSTQIDCIPLNIDHLTQSSYDQAYAASLVNSSLAGFRSISFPGRDDPVDIQLSALESGAYVLGVRALVDQVYDDIGSCQDVFRLLVANSAQPIVEPSIDGESNDLTLQKMPFDLPKLQGAVNAAVQLSDKTKYDLNSLVTYLKILYDTSTQMRPSSDPVTYDKNNIKDDNYYTGNSDDSLTSVSMSVSVDERIKKLAARHVVKAVVNQPSFTMSFGPPTMSDILLDNKWKKDDEDETSCFLRMDQRRFNYETESPFSHMDT